MIPPGFDPEFHRSPDPTTRRLTKQNASLVQVSKYTDRCQYTTGTSI